MISKHIILIEKENRDGSPFLFFIDIYNKLHFNMKKNKTTFLERTLRDLNKSAKILQEAFDFSDEEQFNDEEIPAQEEFDGEEGNAQNDDMNGQDLSQQDDRIARIREVALEGLQEYAENVDSELYQFYKKIWLMCDKAVSEKDNASVG